MNKRPLCGLLLVCGFVALVWWSRASRPPKLGGPLSEPSLGPAIPRVVTISQPVERSVTAHEDFVGRTEPSQEALVRSILSGEVVRVHRPAGAEVKKGEPLFDLDARPFLAAVGKNEAVVKRLEADYDKAAVASEKSQKGLAGKTVGAKEVDAARDAVNRAERALFDARAELTKARQARALTTITAPIDGIVGPHRIAKGSAVVSGATVLTVVAGTRPILVSFPVGEKALLRARQRLLDAGVPIAEWPLLLGLANEEGFPHGGSLTLLEASALGTFPNANGTIAPGQRAWLRLPLGKPYKALLVSEDAIVPVGNQDYLFVVTGANVVKRRLVRLGQADEGQRVVVEGVTATDWVVVTGTQRIQTGETVAPQRAAMPLRRASRGP